MDVTLPPTCPVTGERVGEVGAVHPDAWGRMQLIAPPFCDRCGIPFSIDYGAGVLCPACIAEPPAFDRARAAVVYDEASHGLLVGFKHADRTDLAGPLAAWLARAGADILDAGVLIAPVPLHPERLRKRRYNQSALLGAALAKRTGARFVARMLNRTRATPPQKDLSAEARKRNVAGAFKADDGARRLINGARIVLVDDVLTTGATLSACARALKAAGAASVDALVVARVVKGGVGAI